ncbi:patched sphingolipid transporter [Grosmannia clavigera kw1407]|uniref:Patched sphingolipid transporter n=1 Tax=Grosmannia clavigera (strain kw1407 / UAMH 11150) TaxID=655863 RepID=F0X9U6_GROCL|nr:patched sphingolipid transporter [Grosmannia clavigera kw1407]EFX05334.1 patched sphingolipid transporter [Grosmannia clavigera kw1407]
MARLSRFITAGGSAVLLVLAGLDQVAAEETKYTPKHEAGRCAIRGQCGKQSLFSPELPCVDNGLAEEPDAALRQQLVGLCGAKWSTGPICCTDVQVAALKDNLGTVNQLISSCPACKDNFYNLFCTFTCSPDQSLFINVTNAAKKNDKVLVTELDQLVSEEYGTGFYDSCKEVKFGPTNSKAMDLIGGGAKDYHELLAFLGKKRLGGSPFQMNFPAEYEEPEMKPRQMTPKKCNDEDPSFRCACTDCPSVCPALPEVKNASSCHVGLLPCLSFSSILVYSVFVAVLLAWIALRFWYTNGGTKALPLLHDPRSGHDEDDDVEDDDRRAFLYQIIHGSGTTGADIEEPPQSYKLNTMCNAVFRRLGHWAARFPGTSIGASLLVATVLSLGWLRFELELVPEKLWVSPSSAAAQEKAFFDTNFGPFYRAEKIFLVNDTLPTGPGPVLSYDALFWWMNVEKSIEKIKGSEFGMTFDDVCFKPTGKACVLQSVSAYFGSDTALLDKYWKETLTACAKSPVECRPEYGQPLDPEAIFGGFSDVEHVADAPAITVTWVVNNYEEGTPEVKLAMDWERALKNKLLEVQEEATSRGLRLSFSTEISLEEELNKSTNTDAKIVAISYIIMFLYASLALGSTTLSFSDLFHHFGVFVVQSKFGLGFIGVLIVVMSITASIGLFSWFGLKATLIIVDVIPFIVLAVGVDNIFLIVHEFERVNVSHRDEEIERRVALALGRIGPSILFSAITETVSFALGAFVGMPAVRNFAIYAAGAVFINAILQVTGFVSVLALNQFRVEDNRADILFCIPVKSARVHINGTFDGEYSNRRSNDEISHESILQRFLRQRYAPALLKKGVKTVVFVVFGGLFAAAIALMPFVELGLDQRVAIPDGSYLIPYFNDLYDYLDLGPPVYFVTKGTNATQTYYQRELCSRFPSCDLTSLTGILEQERKRTNVSFIASPTASWIDDFFLWLNPDFEDCCVEDGKPCFAERSPPWNARLFGMPEGEEFVHYLKKFLASPTTEECPLGGQASYGQAIVVDSERDTVPASHFRTMHSPLRSQSDFIEAYASARRIASDITASTGVEVFPYSVFYVFFDQYASIVSLSGALLGSAMGIIFLVSWVLLGSFRTALVVAVTVAMTICDITGAMAVMGVSLNAVSLVNLIICVGISVEFCAHIARSFTFPSSLLRNNARTRFVGARDQRAWAALVNVGGSVFSGITLTKLLGVCVLAFTRSKIFEIYYFRVWVALVLFASPHALVFLPVALSVLGGREYLDPENEGGLTADLTNRVREAEDSSDDEDRT